MLSLELLYDVFSLLVLGCELQGVLDLAGNLNHCTLELSVHA